MATLNSTSKSFDNSKQAVIIRPRSTNTLAFIYHDFSDLKNLILFVGSKPQIDEEGKLYFRKLQIPDNSVILRNAYGQVTEVLKFDTAAQRYEIVADSEFKPEHANKVETKPQGEKTKGGMNRQQLKDALTKAKIEFKSGLTKEELQALYDANNKKK